MGTICLAPNGPPVRGSGRSPDDVVARKNSGVRPCPPPAQFPRLAQIPYGRSPLFAISSPLVDRRSERRGAIVGDAQGAGGDDSIGKDST